MADTRWARLEHLYHEALKLDASERPTWLSTMCGADVSLRDDVEILLKYDSAAGGFLERSALQLAARTLANDKTRRREGRRIGGYEVGEHIGVGGMADVYRARDTRLGRAVALKIFDNVISAAALRRFEAEARAASLLNHPNIVTIYGLGEEDDTAYIAMELVEGSTLRERLSEAPFTLERTLGIAVQLADAIAAAHVRGIVHRDLKPENVMISPEWRVKVLDFGVATLEHELRAASEAGADANGEPAADGALFGTAAYMSPEQVVGGPVGPASDQFAFGVITYEMLTGHRPFPGNARPETLHAIVHKSLAPIDSHGGKADALAAVIRRCLAKDPATRYADSAELAAELRRISDDLRAPAGRGGMTRRQVVSLGVAGVAGATAGLLGLRLWSRQTASRTLAVLPFANPERDEGTDYLCDGITETLIRRLAMLPSIRIIARATAFTFKGSPIDPRTVGRQLEADATLCGTVARRSGRVLVSAELVDSSTGTRLWGEEFDRPSADVIAVQDAIVAAIISDGFHLALTTDERRRVLRALTADPIAYDLFLQGLHHFRLDTEEDYLEARDLLTHATDRDRGFALAYVSLASTYSVMAIDGYAAPAETWPAAEQYVKRAMAIDADLPDAHAEAAIAACFYRWDVADAARHWRMAQESRRGEMQSELLTAYALQEWASGRPAAALELARTARQIDPLSTQAAIREADLLAAVGRLSESVSIYDKLIRDSPTDSRAYFGLAEVRAGQRQFDAALSLRQKAHATIGDESLDRIFARARGESGWDEVVRVLARRELDILRRRRQAGGFVSILDFGRLHSRLGDTVAALHDLEAAFDERAAGLVLLDVDPAWNTVRQEPRFVAAVRRVGIRQPA